MTEKKRTVSAPEVEPIDTAQRFDLNPKEVTSIVNGDRVVVLSKGVSAVEIKRSDGE